MISGSEIGEEMDETPFVVVCKCPLELEFPDGSKATGLIAEALIEAYGKLKSLKVLDLGRMPVENGYEEISSLSIWDLHVLEDKGVDLAAYWYATGSYEGSGQLIARVDGRWHLHSMSHCSCYGPIEHFELRKGYETLEELLSHCSDELKKEVVPLAELIKAEQKKNG